MLDKLIEQSKQHDLAKFDVTAPARSYNDKVLVALASRHNWKTEVTLKVMDGAEGRHTRAGLVNGITYAAHQAVEDPNLRVDMEMLGGSYLYADLPVVSGRFIQGSV